MHARMHARTHACTHACTHARTHAHAWACNTCVQRTCACMRAGTRGRTCMQMHTCTHMLTRVHTARRWRRWRRHRRRHRRRAAWHGVGVVRRSTAQRGTAWCGDSTARGRRERTVTGALLRHECTECTELVHGHGCQGHGCTARQATEQHGWTAWHGMARVRGTGVRHGTNAWNARHGCTARNGCTARHGTAQRGTARHGTGARHRCTAQHGTVWRWVTARSLEEQGVGLEGAQQIADMTRAQCRDRGTEVLPTTNRRLRYQPPKAKGHKAPTGNMSPDPATPSPNRLVHIYPWVPWGPVTSAQAWAYTSSRMPGACMTLYTSARRSEWSMFC